MDILLIGLSFLYIFLVIGFSTIIFRKDQGELSRKFIHIMVGNWIFISIFFTDVKAAILVSAVFIIINILSRKYKLIPSMERQDDSWGTVYYSISLFDYGLWRWFGCISRKKIRGKKAIFFCT